MSVCSEFTASSNYGDLAEENTFGFSGMYSDQWDTSNGKFGVLVSFASTDLDFRSDGVEAGVHNLVADAAGPGEDRYVPINVGMRSTFTEREREGIIASMQYVNTDNGFGGLFEYVRSDSRRNWIEHAFFSDDNGGSLSGGAVFSDVSLVSGNIGGIGNGLGPQTRRQDTEILVEDYSLNLEFAPTDRLSLTFDAQYVDATTDNQDVSLFGGLMPQGTGGINADVVGLDGDVPRISFNAPVGATQTTEEYFNDPANFFWRAAMDHLEKSEGDMSAFKLDADYELDGGFARSIEAGVRFAEREQTTRWTTFNWGQLVRGMERRFRYVRWYAQRCPPVVLRTPALSRLTIFTPAAQAALGGNPSGTAMFPNAALVDNHAAWLSEIAWSGLTGVTGRGNTVDGTFTAAEVNRTTEENTSAYVRLNFGTDSPRMDGNIGLRWVEIDTSVAGGITFPTLDPNTAAFATPEQIAFADGTSNTEDSSKSFSKVLPSLNLKFEVVDDVILRFAYSQAIAFPDLGALRYNYNMSAVTTNDINGNPVITGWRQDSGNPFLEPMEADNYDLSVECGISAMPVTSPAQCSTRTWRTSSRRTRCLRA